MLIRNSAQRLKDLMGRFKAVAVVGPRQSGKTTLVRKIYNRKPYVLVEEADDLLPVEIKAGHTISSEFFKNLDYWKSLSGNGNAYVLYGGDLQQKRSSGAKVMNWRMAVKKKRI